MIPKNYNRFILKRVESKFNKILPVAAAVALLSSVSIYFSSIPSSFLILNGTIGIIFLVLFCLRNKVVIEIKILITMSVPVFTAVLSFLDGGFTSAFTTLFLMSNIVGVLFLEKRISLRFSAASVLLFIGLWGWAGTQPGVDTIDIGGPNGLSRC